MACKAHSKDRQRALKECPRELDPRVQGLAGSLRIVSGSSQAPIEDTKQMRRRTTRMRHFSISGESSRRIVMCHFLTPAIHPRQHIHGKTQGYLVVLGLRMWSVHRPPDVDAC